MFPVYILIKDASRMTIAKFLEGAELLAKRACSGWPKVAERPIPSVACGR